MAVKKTTPVKKSAPTPVKKAAPAKAAPVKKAPAKQEPLKKGPSKSKEREKEVSQQAKARNAASKGRSLSSIWDKEADASNASSILPDGEHVVRLNKLELKNTKKGDAAWLEVEAIDGDYTGKKGRQMYKLTDENGDKSSGMDFLARDFALLGKEDVSGDELESTCDELTSEQPMLVVRVRTGNTGYTNVFIQGLAEEGSGNGDGDGDGAASGEIEVGSRVVFEVEGENTAGKVLSITDGTARVKTDEGDKFDVDLSDLSLEESDGGDGDAAEIEVGSKVTFEVDGNMVEGEVTKIKKDDYFVKDSDGDEYKVELSDLTISDGTGEEEGSAEIEVGSRVKWDEEGDEKEGEVVKIKDDSATVKDDDDDKYKVELSNLTLVEAD